VDAAAWRRELARKAIHLTAIVVPAALALGLPRRVTALTLGALALVALLVELLRAHSAAGARWFEAIFAPLLRAHERRGLTGATWLLASMCAGVALFPLPAAIAATWAAAVGDAAAALVGMRWGRHRSARDGKSLEGSIACAVATFAGAWLLARLPLPLAIVVGVVAAIAERLLFPRDDNARLVAIVGLAATAGLALG
jgi:dolichol kinase